MKSLTQFINEVINNGILSDTIKKKVPGTSYNAIVEYYSGGKQKISIYNNLDEPFIQKLGDSTYFYFKQYEQVNALSKNSFINCVIDSLKEIKISKNDISPNSNGSALVINKKLSQNSIFKICKFIYENISKYKTNGDIDTVSYINLLKLF